MIALDFVPFGKVVDVLKLGKYTDEAMDLMRRYGDNFTDLMRKYGDEFSEMLGKYSEEMLELAGIPSSYLDDAARYGDDLAISASKHGDEAASAGKKASGAVDDVIDDALPGRNGALNQAKKDANIPKSQQPDSVTSTPMRQAEYEGGHVIKDADGNIINTREYNYTNSDGKKITIQDHGAGHEKGGQGPHFNVRPSENTRTGKVEGTLEHYPFNK
ncbi:hypothetical protein IW492_17420 [Enterococcus sp. BWB1-3]|nr:hypothetical protein [Enterococcus sp. BWB1-3]